MKLGRAGSDRQSAFRANRAAVVPGGTAGQRLPAPRQALLQRLTKSGGPVIPRNASQAAPSRHEAPTQAGAALIATGRRIAASAAIAFSLALAPATPVAAQDPQTLADIRQELSVVYVELQKLKRELSTTQGAGGVQAAGSVLDRVNAIEAQLQALTSRTEEMQNRIDRVVSDGTNRIGDLEFRVCEIEPNCDFGEIGDTLPIGGEAPSTSGGGGSGSAGAIIPESDMAGGSNATSPSSNGPALAVAEQADFDRAKEALDSGSFQSAVDLFAAFTQTYPGGPLTGAAHFWRGEALAEQGKMPEAARAYLESFSSDPQGNMAADALYKLGTSLAELGQTNEACTTLGEVQVRFPDSDVSFDAGAARRSIGCS